MKTMAEKASVLVVDDDDVFRGVLVRELSARGYAATGQATGARGLEAATAAPPEIVLLDLRLPDVSGLEVLRGLRERAKSTEVLVLTGHGTIDTAIEAIRLGAFDYVAKPCPLAELEIRMDKALERHRLIQRNDALERGFVPPDTANAFVGASSWHEETCRLIEKFGPSEASVLILGETGTGKEVIAKRLHATSARRDKAFVAVDSAALHEELLQSELFGHERGAFTGATHSKPGLFEVADQGTIFLDEVGDMSLATQVKLLRVLETSSFRRLGGTKSIHVNVRVLAATNRDLEAGIRQNLFRMDLFYRLGSVRLDLKPLRERPEDIRVIANHYLSHANARFRLARALSDEALAALVAYPWPGNVRELLHTVERAMILSDGPVIELEHLPPCVRAPAVAAKLNDAEADLVSLKVLERAHIERVLRATGGHRQRAARILGISERNLYRKLRGLGLAH